MNNKLDRFLDYLILLGYDTFYEKNAAVIFSYYIEGRSQKGLCIIFSKINRGLLEVSFY